MISIIISSYNEKHYQQFCNSVSKSIGVAHEIIKIPNSGLMGIAEAYNKGAEKAKYPYLCFIHEDIIFNNINWGENLIQHFSNNPKVGLIGMAGSSYKPFIPSGWSFPQKSRLVYMNVKQPAANLDGNIVNFINIKNPNRLAKVACIDGCFMATLHHIWKQTKFDQCLFKNFHCYDIDFSISVSSNYDVAVVNDVLITHLSAGKFEKSWIEETIKLHHKWNGKLPVKADNISKIEQREQEIGAFNYILRRTIELNLSKYFLLKILLTYKSLKYIGIKEWIKFISKITYHTIK